MITAAFGWTGVIFLVASVIALPAWLFADDDGDYERARVYGLGGWTSLGLCMVMVIAAIWTHALTGGN